MTEREHSSCDQLEPIPDCSPSDYLKLCVDAHKRLREDVHPDVRVASRNRIKDAFKLLIYLNIPIGELIVPEMEGLLQRKDH